MRFYGLAMAAGLAALSTGAMAMDGDIEAGATVFKKCAACHVVEEAKNRVGPTLNGLIGRKPGTVEGFKYSKANVEFGESNVWDVPTLTTYLANPRAVVKGTRMAFAGLKDEADIANVIAYIAQYSPEAGAADAAATEEAPKAN